MENQNTRKIIYEQIFVTIVFLIFYVYLIYIIKVLINVDISVKNVTKRLSYKDVNYSNV